MIEDKQIILSICIPTYNRCDRVFNTVEEILYSYDEDDIEIVVIDDCSVDHTVDLLNRIKDKRLRIIRNETRLGQAKNQFFALWSGNGKYVKVLIDRDKMFVNRVKKFVQTLSICNAAIVIEGEEDEYINANINGKGWYKMCTRTHPSSLTYKRSALHKTCKYNEILSIMEYKDTPYIYFPSIVNVILYYKYKSLLCLRTSYTYQQKGNTISGNYCLGGTDYYRESGAEKRFALYYKMGLIERGKVKRNYSLYAGELRNATVWNWESSDIAKKRTGQKTKTKSENMKDNFLFWKYSYKFFAKDLFSQISVLGITLFNVLRILFWKNKNLEKIWVCFF